MICEIAEIAANCLIEVIVYFSPERYCHPLEHILSNVLPVAGGSVIMQSHTSVTWLWMMLATLTTLNNHSGYHLPFSHSSEFHDFHHLK